MNFNEKIDSMKPASDQAEPTPAQEVMKIFILLGDYYEDGDLGSRGDLANLFKSMRECPEDCSILLSEELADKERELLNGAAYRHELDVQFALFDLALAHCVEALRPGLSINQQWWRVCWAHNCLGRLHGSILGQATGGIAAIAGRAKHGADARHKENRDMKKDVFEWLTKNMDRFTSLESAAEAIARDVAPIKVRTARDWVGQWKKAQSSGKSNGQVK